MVALLRAQRRYDEALELSMSLFEAISAFGLALQHPSALDTGQWHDAKSILDELIKSDSKDPRVQALAVIFGYGTKGPAPRSFTPPRRRKRHQEGLDIAPVNAYAAVLQKGGLDEAMNANVLIAAHEATRRAVAPRYSPSILSRSSSTRPAPLLCAWNLCLPRSG